MVDVGVEGAHREQDRVGILTPLTDALLAVDHDTQTVLPPPSDLVIESERVDARAVKLEVTPEQQHQLRRERSEARVVKHRLTFVEVVDQQRTHRDRFDAVAVDEFGDGTLARLHQRVRVAWRVGAERAGLDQQPVPQGPLLHGVGELRGKGFAAIINGDVGQRAAVVDQDPNQMLERRRLIVGTEAGQRRAELSQTSEAIRVAERLDLSKGGMRQEPEQPAVARTDDVQDEQRTGAGDQRRTAVTRRSDTRIGDLVRPLVATIVESAGDPTLLPRETVEPGQPVQHHDQAAASLKIELAAPVVVINERVEPGQHRVAISCGPLPRRDATDRHA